MASDTPTAAGGQEQLSFSDAAGCKAWLAQLPRADAARAHALLAAQVRLLPSAEIAPATKLEILELLREPVEAALAEQAKNVRGKPIPLDQPENEAWQEIVALWRTMATGYDTLIDAMATTAPDLAAQAHVICERALRYTASTLFEYCYIYHSPDGALWQQLHRLYVFSENAGMASTPVEDRVGRQTPTTTCAGIYAHALLLHLAQPDAMNVEDLDILDRWLERWEGLAPLSPDPLPQSGIPAMAVDLASQKGACLAKNLPAAGVRYLNLEPLSRTLRQTAAALKQQTPAQLGLGNLPREAGEKLVLRLHMQWCAAGTGRIDERTPASIKVMIAPNIASMHFHLTGKAFRQPGGTITAAERQRMELLGATTHANVQALASQRSAALETWVIVNQSLSGFLGTTREKEVVHRIGHHQLVALQPPAKKVMYLGIVQRLNVDETGMVWIGLRIILGSPQAAAARIVETTSPGQVAVVNKFDRALLMPEDAARNTPASIVLMPGWYRPNRELVVVVDKEKERKIRLQTLLDKGHNFERATYTAA